MRDDVVNMINNRNLLMFMLMFLFLISFVMRDFIHAPCFVLLNMNFDFVSWAKVIGKSMRHGSRVKPCMMDGHIGKYKEHGSRMKLCVMNEFKNKSIRHRYKHSSFLHHV